MTSPSPTPPHPSPTGLEISTPPPFENGANSGGGVNAEGVEATLTQVAMVLTSTDPPPDPRDIDLAVSLLRPRVAAGEIQSPVAWARGVVSKREAARLKAEAAKEPKRAEIAGEVHEYDPATGQWLRVDETVTS